MPGSKYDSLRTYHKGGINPSTRQAEDGTICTSPSTELPITTTNRDRDPYGPSHVSRSQYMSSRRSKTETSQQAASSRSATAPELEQSTGLPMSFLETLPRSTEKVKSSDASATRQKLLDSEYIIINEVKAGNGYTTFSYVDTPEFI
ncbi:hypothetical protein L198_02513 [Cryptococcus wingfieldii CBS 7118]|uniref:Uncharacterized protein n=1 Tax=Cryptococcus wingfieldii CBS 7118 TaxID=1295528 RepID=A0A1E3JUP9_9TREE|nr:hypothetical protein L198_02513 [Cryptococcus wingfieldii CBS 7118]ODO03662.1 hypothetical protein L198_02513 [Cryptococcus wingfieldii CBS 7118]